MPVIRIIRPASREKESLLPARIAQLEQAGFKVLHEELPLNPAWTYTSSTIQNRTRALMEALTEPDSTIVLCARGGYGASDLLAHLDWTKLAQTKPKLLVGFSDNVSIQSALYANCGWPSIHGPMPASNFWTIDPHSASSPVSPDVADLFRIMHAWSASTGTISGSLPVAPICPGILHSKIEGTLYGGCLSVLTNLIATPYMPRSLAGHILFFEDIGENPARLLRFFTQWIHSGILEGVRAVVIGALKGLGGTVPDNAPFVLEEWARRTPIPLYASTAFGHISPNFPLAMGADASIQDGQLFWKLEGEISRQYG